MRIVPIDTGAPKRNVKRPRLACDAHLAAIRQCRCAVCGTTHAVEAAHLSMTSRRHGHVGRGMGAKADDRWATPLCHACHMEQHRIGERDFWAKHRIDPHLLALALWGASGDLELMNIIIGEVR